MSKLLALFAALVLSWPAAAAPPTLEFDVLRDGAPIGKHRVTIERDGTETRATIEIDMAVRLAFVTVYRYTHRSTELWREGRLVSLDARTDDNGTRTQVSARATDAGLATDGSGGRYDAPAETVPTSYWNREKVMRSPLLDTQSGKLIDVSAMALAADANGTRYRLAGDLEADLVYGPGGDWTGLSFAARGARIDYVRRDMAASAAR
ncbi:MAG: hypothetical protein IBJ15_04615 [Alphaproteobacteria bacterium]|nr:hypothetical protein [Alphaproteobacteria bacterium]